MSSFATVQNSFNDALVWGIAIALIQHIALQNGKIQCKKRNISRNPKRKKIVLIPWNSNWIALRRLKSRIFDIFFYWSSFKNVLLLFHQKKNIKNLIFQSSKYKSIRIPREDERTFFSRFLEPLCQPAAADMMVVDREGNSNWSYHV